MQPHDAEEGASGRHRNKHLRKHLFSYWSEIRPSTWPNIDEERNKWEGEAMRLVWNGLIRAWHDGRKGLAIDFSQLARVSSVGYPPVGSVCCNHHRKSAQHPCGTSLQYWGGVFVQSLHRVRLRVSLAPSLLPRNIVISSSSTGGCLLRSEVPAFQKAQSS